jgi:hypothetical protein
MRTHYVMIRQSGRIVPAEVSGPIFLVLSGRSVHGPYRRKDRRFTILPREHKRTY